MDKVIVLFLTSVFWGTIFRVEAQGFVWTTQIGMSGGPIGERVAVDSSGNVYIAGGFQGTARFGNTNLTSAGGNDVFLAKFDSKGELLWAKQAGGIGDDAAQDIAVDTNGNVYVTGGFNQTATFDNTTLTATVGTWFLAKYNSNGALIWAHKSGGTTSGSGNGVAVDPSGNIYTTGYYQNFNGWYSIIIDKWNGSGLQVWHKEMAGLPNYQWPLEGNSIKADAAGNVYVTGIVGTQVTMGTNVLSTPGNFGSAVFIAKLDQNGNFAWAKQPGQSQTFSSWGASLALDNSGNIFVVGNYGGTLVFGTNQLTTPDSEIGNGFVVKCDNDGNYLWAQQTLRRNGGSCSGCAVDSAGNVYVTGYVSFAQAFLEKYDGNGNPVWELDPANADYANEYGTAVDASNRVSAVTWCNANIAFDNDSFTNMEGSDIFLSQVSEQIPPVFVTQPQNSPAGILPGAPCSFNASTRSVFPVTYQWQFNGVAITGATNASLALTNIQYADQGGYSVTASNLYGSSTSQVAQLTVYFTTTLIVDGTGAASITPNGVSSYPGNSLVTFAVATNFTSSFIGWSGDVAGTNPVISTLITSNLYVVASFADSTTNIVIDDLDRRAVFSGNWPAYSFYGEYGSDFRYSFSSNTASSSVTYRPVISVPGPYDVFVWYPSYGFYYGFSTNAPWSVVCGSGAVATNVDETANGGSWLLIASGLYFSAGTNGFVSLSNDSGESPPRLVVADAVRFFPSQPPLVTVNPQSLVAKVGSRVTFGISVSGSSPFTYQWVFNGTNLPDGNDGMLAIPFAQPSNAGQYSVVVSNVFGNASSSNATLTLTPPAAPVLGTPGLNSNGRIQLVLSGDPGVSFTVQVSTNLADWTVLTNLFNASGTTVFSDLSGENPAKFYRAAWLPQ